MLLCWAVCQTGSYSVLKESQLCCEKSLYATKRGTPRVRMAHAVRLATVYARANVVRYPSLDKTAFRLDYLRR